MQKTVWIGICLFLVLIFSIQMPLHAQSKKYFVITGKIVPEESGNGNGVIEIIKNDKDKSTIEIPKNGRFRLELDFFNEFNLNFKYPGHFNKIITVTTQIPQDVWERDNDFPAFPMIVQLFKEFEGIDKSFTLKPVAKIFYGKGIDNFDKESYFSDIQVLEQIATAKSQASQVQKEAQSISKENSQDLAAKQRNFDQLIKEADTNYQRGEYQMALIKYQDAKNLFPDRAYPIDRVAELQDLVKALENAEKQKAELEEKYKNAIARGNEFFDQKQYSDAKPKYQEALQYKPGDVFSSRRINEIDQLLAQLEKQKQYKDLIDQADKNYLSKNYDQALSYYNQAKQVLPEENYPDSQISRINLEKQEQAKLDQLEKDFNQIMQTAGTSAQQKDYLQALNLYKKALELKPNNQLTQDKIAEMNKAIVDVENEKKYLQAIQLADQALASNDLERAKIQYQEAIRFKGAETYPKNKLAEISVSEANEIKFEGLVSQAEKAFSDNNFDEALNSFNQALAIKPQDKAVLKRIDDIQTILNQQLTDKGYTDLITQADQFYQSNQFDLSASAYNKALQVKKSEPYPKEQVQKIGSYQTLIKKADKLFDSNDYDGSKGIYNEALALIPDATYALGRIAEIDKRLGEKRLIEEKAKTELLAYNEALQNADQLFIAQKYSESLNKYKEASTIKPAENYPKKRIKEVETILDGIAKEMARKEQEYQAIIAQADRLMSSKDYLNSKNEYQKAVVLKPEDTYPKEQIKKIDDTLAEIKRQEEDRIRNEHEKRDQEFNQAMAAADQSFESNDFKTAKTGYQSALVIKPTDPTAKEKLGKTEAKLAEIARLTQAYNKAIDQGNSQLTAKKYPEAKEKYQEALQYLPDSEYPKQQIAKIDELLNQLEAEVQVQQNFDQALAEGENLLKAKELTKAKDAFMKAYNLIPSEPVPPKRISEITALLAEQTRKDSELKATLEVYQAAIQKADKHFGNKEYTLAKLAYNEALLIKPDEKYPVDQLALIDVLLKKQIEQNYKDAITRADNSFNANQLDEAATSYKEALKFKKGDQYATNRLKEIEQRKSDLVAENNRLKKLEDQYNTLIADANKDFNNKVYPDSKGKYQKALTLKPAESYPKDQIAKIDQILAEQQNAEETNKKYNQFIKDAEVAFKQNKLKEARDLFQNGSNLKPNEPLPPLRIAEIDEMLAQLDETAKLKAMEDAQRLAKEKADRQQYENDIAAGDKAFTAKEYKTARLHYSSALTVMSNEKYPKDQIAKIDELLLQEEMNKSVAQRKAAQDSLLKVKNQLFDAALASAKDHEQNNRYNQAIEKYNEAISIKPEQRPTIQKYIKEIEDRIQLLAKRDQDYQVVIKLADNYFTKTDLENALTQFKKASTIKPDEEYPKTQISLIESQLATREESYSAAIKNGDEAFDASDWANAKTAYTSALEIKPKEQYPLNRLKEVNQKISEANLAAIKNDAENKAYKEAIEKAQNLLDQDQLTSSRTQFQVAQTLKPNETLPAEKIAEIDALLEKRNNDRLAQAQRELDEKYRQAISVADISYKEKSYPTAKIQYQQALLIKPEEAYPKDQMALIDKLIREAKVAETEVSIPTPKPIINPEETVQATESRALAFQTVTDYDEAVKKADESFGIKDYSVARFYYYKASDIKPAEDYPKKQLEQIRKLIDSQLSSGDIAAYEQAIAQADNAFASRNYTIAKFFYYKALGVKSWEQYPKDRINEILALTNSLLSENEEKEYRDMIAKADEAFFGKEISIARFYYNKASAMKKDEEYPKIKLKDIRKLVEEDQLEQANQEYQRIVDAGDEALKSENYSMARFNYNKALSMKPGEKYPKDQLKLIKEALDKKSN